MLSLDFGGRSVAVFVDNLNPPPLNIVTTLTEPPRLLKVIEPSRTTFGGGGLIGQALNLIIYYKMAK
jgi:hypothetical protein